MPACSPRRSWQSSMTAPMYSFGAMIDAWMNGSRISSIVPGSGMSEGLWTSSSSPLVERHVELDRRHRREQLEVVLALQALAHDVHVQQPEEAAAEAEAERVGGLRLPRQRGVVERQLLERVAQVRVAVGVDREEPAEDHRLDLPVAGQRFAGGRAGRRARRARVVSVSPTRSCVTSFRPVIR